MRKKLIIECYVDSVDFSDLMKEDDLTLEEAIGQQLDDGELNLEDLSIITWRLE